MAKKDQQARETTHISVKEIFLIDDITYKYVAFSKLSLNPNTGFWVVEKASERLTTESALD